MNPDLKNLRVAVVPTETDNGIDQSSTYEEIVACEETMYYSVPDYFKAQNDEELPLQHWSFLLDYEKKVDITGCNTDGIDMDTKAIKIAYIKNVIREWGDTTSSELGLESSPCLSSIGNGKKNISELVETFKLGGVETVVYQDQDELAENYYMYEDLPEDIISEIEYIMQDYEADSYKTAKRCQD